MTIECIDIVKTFNKFTALRGVSLATRPGEFLALLGPSGSGKTTLLRVMAGLEFPDAGIIKFDQIDMSGSRAAERRVGFVFQHYALFRHMTVAENIAFGLRVKNKAERPQEEAIKSRVAELLRLIQLDHLGARYPSQLSGGQKQRVALARALAVQPRILLLDEPFGALDAKVRKDLRRWLRQIHQEMGLTSVFVTHDQEEALELADRVVVMSNGQIEQVGTPEEVYNNPASAFVCDFLGNANAFRTVVDNGQGRIGDYTLNTREFGDHRNVAAIAYVRPHEFHVAPAGAGGGVRARINRVFAAGPGLRLDCESLDGHGALEIAAPDDTDVPLQAGSEITLIPRRLRLFRAPVSS